MEYVKVISYLISEFKFGFELEALSKKNYYKGLRNIFNNYFKGGKFASETSITGKGLPFEYNSPPLKATPLNFKKFKDLLLGLPKHEIHTNESCGLHIHVSFPYLSRRDIIWVILNLAVTSKYFKHITKFKSYKFVNENYASDKFFYEINEAFQEKDYTTLYELMSTEKSRVVRIHPQGTIEWRGPRSFLDKGNIKHINDFITHLYKYIKMLNTILESKSLEGEHKKDILDKILQPVVEQQKTQEELRILLEKRFHPDQDSRIAMIIAKKFPKFFEKNRFEKLLVTKISKKLIIDDIEWNYGEFEDCIWKNGIWEDGIWFDGEWHNGTWKNGEWFDGEWHNGTWKGGEWNDGSWRDGTWKRGTWEGGEWVDGTWEMGIWFDGSWWEGTWQEGTWQEGTWHDGVWEDGIWENGVWEDGRWEDGVWEEGEWQDGIWENGEWSSGVWKKGVWHNGTWLRGTWQEGTWYKGTWKDGTWLDGTWRDGTWENGEWQDGIWENGEWYDGTWLGGYDKEENYHPEGDSPDKWEIGG